MADRPIIFSAPMVRALLAGWKAQTRRVLKPQPVPCLTWSEPPAGTYPSDKGWSRIPYAPGDRLYVREACHIDGRQVNYRADAPDGSNPPGPWRPSIHMPRWASRLTLTVTDVRVQRLHEISEADAVAEGSQEPSLRQLGGDLAQAAWSDRQVFQRLWNSLHGPEAWGANPWVSAISFTVQRGNIDQIGATDD